MRSKKRTVVILIVVIVILLGFAGSLLVYRNKLSSSVKNTSSDNIAQSLLSTSNQKIIEDFYDKPITDEKIALDSIEVNRDKLGYGDKNFSFEFERKEEWMGASYSFKLFYKDILVNGKGISVITNSDNSADVLMTGGVDVEKISKINTTPKITKDEALDIAKETLGEDFSEYNISSNFKHVKISPQLIIYETKNQYVLSYIYSGNYTCIIDAQNGNVIETHSSLVFNSAEYEGQNGDIHQVFYDDYKDDNYDIKNLLWNKDKNIYIFDDVEGAQNYIPINVFTIDDIQSGKNKSAVDGMANTYRAVEYFEQNHNLTFDATFVEVNDDDEVKNNSGGRSWVTTSGSSVANIVFGVYLFKNQDSCRLDDVGHEYTHAVTNLKVFGNGYKKDSKYFERNALQEAYSDIFGQLVEQKYTGKTDWIQSDTGRNLKKPKINIYSKLDKNDDYDKFAHNNSTIISHTAYLMSQDNDNKKYDNKYLLDYDQLGQLWYESLEYLKNTEFMDFSDCRYAVEKSAKKLIEEGILLEGNLKIIEQAFNDVEVSGNPIRHGMKDSAEIIKDKNTLVVPIEDETTPSEPVEITEVESTETTTITKIETTTTTTESTQTIPEEASTYNGHSYIVYPESMTWQEAKEYCENLGGHLVTISDADEQKFIEDLAEKYTDKVSYWLGGYYSDAEWKWVDDTEFSYTNWDSWTDGEKEYRQPDNFTGDEFYLRFANQKMQYENWYSNKGKWNDIANEADGTSGDVPLDSFGLICEWDNVSQDNTTETEATANIVDSGTCGDNLTWTLDTNGQLTIEGKGEMYNYYTPYNKSADSPPWRYQKIKSVVIKSGVTSIGNGAFGWQDDLGNVSIADTVTSIGVYSFFSCDSLVYLDSVYQISEKITSIGKGAFDLCCNMRCVYVGKNVTKLDDYSLDPTYIGTIYGYEGSEAQAYAGRNGISFVCVDDDYGYHGTISNQNGASFRSGSSEKSKEISVIPYGTEVSEYDSTGDWALIKYKGTLGYVYKDDLLFEGGFAKPVIYLYPEKKQDVSVKVNFKNGDFTCTYPEYNNGWNVTAYPNGRIINKSDNDEYSYLYWEGEGAIQYDFSSGFVVKREDTAEFLKEKLSYMGLSPKEYNEFIVYWLPIMQKNKYNLISFQMENYEESAQLEVSPKPDSMLRVFMAFQEADADTKVPEQQLKPFQREGFTVIEWGGTEVQ